jgi:hypothetical protein
MLVQKLDNLSRALHRAGREHGGAEGNACSVQMPYTKCLVRERERERDIYIERNGEKYCVRERHATEPHTRMLTSSQQHPIPSSNHTNSAHKTSTVPTFEKVITLPG